LFEVGISGALFFGSFLLDEQKKGTEEIRTKSERAI
jgi:hypothetical protein